MKNLSLKISVLFAALVATTCFLSKEVAAKPQNGISIQVFYDELAPYGDWIEDPEYGYVWVPNEIDFHPYYTNGYWEMTVYGNTWISFYPWGWAPFHYGRWTYDPYYGWIWIPGYSWAPAWVCWRYGGGFYGWAPLGPSVVLSLSFNAYPCPYNWWIFTPHHYLYGPRHSTHYALNVGDAHIRQSVIVGNIKENSQTNVIYPAGPSAEEIRENTGQSPVVKEIVPADMPGKPIVDERTLHLYRPQVNREPNQVEESRPGRFQYAPQPVKIDQPARNAGNETPPYKAGGRPAEPPTDDKHERRKQERTLPEPAIPKPVERKPTQQNPDGNKPGTPKHEIRVRPASPARNQGGQPPRTENRRLLKGTPR